MNKIKNADAVDKQFFYTVDGFKEECNSTGYLVLIKDKWYHEYIDHNGDLHYARKI